MSIGHTSSSTAMEVSSASHSESQIQSKTQVPTVLPIHHPHPTSSIAPNCSSLTVTSTCDSIISTDSSESTSTAVNGQRIATDASVGSMMESLRWEQECSDEEKEERRIELYKANRRKRYENALEEKRTQLIRTDKQCFYYSPSESIS